MTIGELATESSLPASTIRYWEKIGVLPKPVRVGGQRRYSADAVQRLAVLRLARACGFRLDEMRHLLHGFGPGVKPPRRWQELARRKQQELDEQISRLKAMLRVVDRVLQLSVRRTARVWANCHFRHGIGFRMNTLLWFLLAAGCEVAGCFAFWPGYGSAKARSGPFPALFRLSSLRWP